LSKGDIRSFGKVGIKTSTQVNEKQIFERIKSLKRSKTNLLPNLSDRMKAGQLIDIIEDNKAINVKKGSGKKKKLQKDGFENVCIVGHDVKSLFPSLKNAESARLTRYAVLNSKVDVENFDHKMALRYIFIVGGRDLISKAKLSRHMPKWLGDREDLTAVGGRKSKAAESWKDSDRTLWPSEKRQILATLMEIMVNVVMGTHIYYFAGKFFLQSDSGPIGLRSTASLAALIMKLWDTAWLELVDREGLELLDYFRYVDDCRNMLFCLLEGWRWVDNEFKFSEAWEIEDLNSDVTDSSRTMTELTKAMSSLISYIEFEGEEPGMFPGNKLPTLDTAIWWNGSCFMYEFWEKPTVPNRVLQSDTALAESLIRSSLNQDVVRRLLHCHLDVPNVRKSEFLSVFAQKLVNSGFSVPSAQLILVHGVTKYTELVKNSKLPETHPKFKPIHFDRNFKLLERKLQKYLAKSCWYEQDNTKKCSWRSNLPEEWKGAKPIQQRMPGMTFSSLLQVQNSKNGRLIKSIAKIEPRLSKSTSYNIKL